MPLTEIEVDEIMKIIVRLDSIRLAFVKNNDYESAKVIRDCQKLYRATIRYQPMPCVQTPKGIMYLVKTIGDKALCYDDQTGKEETFLKSEIKEIQK